MPIPLTKTQKGKSSHRIEDEFVQRRTRRPFFIVEIEALVHAVEELGTRRYDVINNISLLVGV